MKIDVLVMPQKPKEHVVDTKVVHVRDYKGKALAVPQMKDKSTSRSKKKVGNTEGGKKGVECQKGGMPRKADKRLEPSKLNNSC